MPKPRRNVNAVAEETLTPPLSLPESQHIARLKQAAGNNLYRLELPSGEAILAELPSKFRSTIWLKRDAFVVVDTAALATRSNKLGGEIVNIVGDEKTWRKAAFWPVEFGWKKSVQQSELEDDGPQMPPSDDEAGI